MLTTHDGANYFFLMMQTAEGMYEKRRLPPREAKQRKMKTKSTPLAASLSVSPVFSMSEQLAGAPGSSQLLLRARSQLAAPQATSPPAWQHSTHTHFLRMFQWNDFFSSVGFWS